MVNAALSAREDEDDEEMAAAIEAVATQVAKRMNVVDFYGLPGTFEANK
jgi:hypothetical protein